MTLLSPARKPHPLLIDAAVISGAIIFSTFAASFYNPAILDPLLGVLALSGWITLVVYIIILEVIPETQDSIIAFLKSLIGFFRTKPERNVSLMTLEHVRVLRLLTVDAKAAPEAARGYSYFEGFRSFVSEGEITIDHIVSGLSRQMAPKLERDAEAVPPSAPDGSYSIVWNVAHGDVAGAARDVCRYSEFGGVASDLVLSAADLFERAQRMRLGDPVEDGALYRAINGISNFKTYVFTKELARPIDPWHALRRVMPTRAR